MNAIERPVINAKFSIFLPVKNGGEYIAEAIESILAQQMPEFALVILENKSTDNTLEIVQRYSDPRIVVIEATNELDIYESWRRVYDLLHARLVTSEFSTVIGHDDVLYPNFLNNIEELAAAFPEASLYQTHFDLIDEHGNVRRTCKPIPLRECAKDFFMARCWGMRDSFGTGYVFRSEDYVKVGGIPDLPTLLWSDDLLIIRLTKLSYKVCGCQPSFAYRLHNKSASGEISFSKIIAHVRALNLFVDQIDGWADEFLKYQNDKIGFGYFIARQIELMEFPLSRLLLGKVIERDIARANVKASQLLGKQTVPSLSEMNMLARMWRELEKYYITLKLFKNKVFQLITTEKF